ncbi:hypothetical protein K435DRAFT_112718 [Dendrothele bispora CBS 962.96]|uniref:Uncharacterized protein n=1 Tax=Dendrothele bispora (strain CBS 962.96) TaxID=1314807 RepID=A0A4S8KN13_DENBC|nr:hypothetical protein K435DRAFT_112718 [Dendrothele bispora CBS 962.96]
MSGRKRTRPSSPLDSSEEDDDQRTSPIVARGKSTRQKSRRGPTSDSNSVNDGSRAKDHSETPATGPSSRRPQLASSNASTVQSTRLESNLETTVFGLRFPSLTSYEAFIPLRGVPTAVDHEDQKLYVLTYHSDDNGTEPGTVIHCLDLKTKAWDGFLHNIKSTHSFDNSPGNYLPPCVFTNLTFIKHRNGQKYLFIVGGYFGDPEDHLSKGRYLHLNGDDMHILVIDIAKSLGMFCTCLIGFLEAMVMLWSVLEIPCMCLVEEKTCQKMYTQTTGIHPVLLINYLNLIPF